MPLVPVPLPSDADAGSFFEGLLPLLLVELVLLPARLIGIY
jgi:hypothetical protein